MSIHIILTVVDSFAAKVPSPTTTATTMGGVLQNWISIVHHLQNPALYSAASWANRVQVVVPKQQQQHESDNDTNQQHRLLAAAAPSSDDHGITAGTVLSLIPIHDISLEIEDDTKARQHQEQGRRTFISFSSNLTRPHEYHRAAGIPPNQRVVVRTADGTEASSPGWQGHLATTFRIRSGTRNNDKDDDGDAMQQRPNCRVVPLLGALPLCALVATCHVPVGTPLVVADNDDDEYALEALALQVLKRYTAEILELRSYTSMAHPFTPASTVNAAFSSRNVKFHSIDHTYPGIQQLHTSPDIWKVDNFLTPQECRDIIHLARPRLAPCLVKNEDTGKVEPDPSRTSTNANLPQSLLPSVTVKVCQLLQCPSPNHLEIFQVLRYTAGQTFVPHTDGFHGPIDACGFEQSGRLVTLFCYLKTMPDGAGGETRFTQLDENVSITPKEGQAVVHFPNTVDLVEDVRTEHESVPVEQGEKWLFVTWCWKHARSNPAYHEGLLE